MLTASGRLTTVKEIKAAIRKAPVVYVGACLTTEDVVYFQVSKTAALSRIIEYANMDPDAERMDVYRVSVDADGSVWIN